MKGKGISKGVATLTLGIGLGVGVLLLSNPATSDEVPMVVYKHPSCGCCTKWAEYLDERGFATEIRAVQDLPRIKEQAGVPRKLASCHTAKVGDYFIEGHVPAEDIVRLLKEKPDIAGLSAPGMPVGSPGMEAPGRKPDKYKVYAIDRQGRAQLFASH